MKDKIEVSEPRDLAHVLQFTADEDSRPILAAVQFRARDRAIIATNGHVLALYRDAHDATEDIALTIPRAAEKTIREAGLLSIERASGDLWILKPDCSREFFGCQRLDAPYPDVDVVMPKGEPVPMAELAINVKYLALFMDNGHRRPVLTLHGDAKAIGVRYIHEPRFTGIIMPMRTD